VPRASLIQFQIFDVTSLHLPNHLPNHHWKPEGKAIWPSAFPPHWPPGNTPKENFSPDVSVRFLTLCLEPPSSPTSWEPARKGEGLERVCRQQSSQQLPQH